MPILKAELLVLIIPPALSLFRFIVEYCPSKNAKFPPPPIFTYKGAVGFVVPMPTFPLTIKPFVGAPAFPAYDPTDIPPKTCNLPAAFVGDPPTPTLPAYGSNSRLVFTPLFV